MTRVWMVGVAALSAATPALAQDLGPHFRKISDGIYVQTAREVNSNVGIILTSEGVVLIDSGQTLIDTREVAEALKKLTPLPVSISSTRRCTPITPPVISCSRLLQSSSTTRAPETRCGKRRTRIAHKRWPHSLRRWRRLRRVTGSSLRTLSTSRR